MSQQDPGADGVHKDGSGEHGHGQVVQGNVHYDAQQQGGVNNSVVLPYMAQHQHHSINALVPQSMHQPSSTQFTMPMHVQGAAQPMSPTGMQKHSIGGQWPSVAFSRGPDKKKRQREDFNQTQLKRLIEVA